MTWLVALAGACFAGSLWISYSYGKYVGQHRERLRIERELAPVRRVVRARHVRRIS